MQLLKHCLEEIKCRLVHGWQKTCCHSAKDSLFYIQKINRPAVKFSFEKAFQNTQGQEFSLAAQSNFYITHIILTISCLLASAAWDNSLILHNNRTNLACCIAKHWKTSVEEKGLYPFSLILPSPSHQFLTAALTTNLSKRTLWQRLFWRYLWRHLRGHRSSSLFALESDFKPTGSPLTSPRNIFFSAAIKKFGDCIKWP